MLENLPILVAENEPFVAMDLIDAINDLKGLSIGPVNTVVEALELLAVTTIKAAILDANLSDRDITPLALALIDRDIPFVLYTGTGLPDELAQLHPDLPVVRKPARSTLVLATLLQRLAPKHDLPSAVPDARSVGPDVY